MSGKTLGIVIIWAVAAAAASLIFWFPHASQLRAQQLSIRHYDVSDGLAHSHVSAMFQDAKGYLWLATWEGLSRNCAINTSSMEWTTTGARPPNLARSITPGWRRELTNSRCARSIRTGLSRRKWRPFNSGFCLRFGSVGGSWLWPLCSSA